MVGHMNTLIHWSFLWLFVSLLLLSRSAVQTPPKKNRLCKTIGVMARLSMGVYLFHVPVMILIRHYGLDFTICNIALSVPLVSALVYCISFAVIFVISKIPVLKSYII